MAGAVRSSRVSTLRCNQPAFHALDPHPGGADVAARSAKIPAFRGEAIICRKSDNSGSQEFRRMLGAVFAERAHQPMDAYPISNARVIAMVFLRIRPGSR